MTTLSWFLHCVLLSMTELDGRTRPGLHARGESTSALPRDSGSGAATTPAEDPIASAVISAAKASNSSNTRVAEFISMREEGACVRARDQRLLVFIDGIE